MIAVAAYCRVSTDKQDQINSFESQKVFFNQYIKTYPDWELYNIYADDGISGTETRKRVQFIKMIQDAKKRKFDLIITKEVSRFSRNILDTIYYTRFLREIGIGVLFVTDNINTMNPEAEMLLSFLASLAQEESRRTSARVVWGQTRQMEKGVVFGHSLLGYDVINGKMHINQDGAKIVRIIYQKYALEQLSISQIAKFLTEKGYQTQKGNTNWNPASISKILRNEKYIGDLLQKKTYTPDYLSHRKKKNDNKVPQIYIQNHHQPIIERELWKMAQYRLDSKNKRKGKTGGNTTKTQSLTKIICGECGSNFIRRNKYYKNGTSVLRWSCKNAALKGTKICNIGKIIRDDDIIQMIKQALSYLPINQNDMINCTIEVIEETLREGEEGSDKEIQRIQKEILNIIRKKERLLDSYYAQEISIEEMQYMKKKYDMLIEKKESEKAEAESKNNISIDEIKHYMEEILSISANEAPLYWDILNSLTVFKENTIELRLQHVPITFHYLKDAFDDRFSQKYQEIRYKQPIVDNFQV